MTNTVFDKKKFVRYFIWTFAVSWGIVFDRLILGSAPNGLIAGLPMTVIAVILLLIAKEEK